jgi:hypothetical protein
VHRILFSIFLLTTAIFAAPPADQAGAAAVQAYFTGKEVVLKIDMPGTQKGVDLKFNKPSPMDWKEYGSRLKQFGTSIRKGDTARVTTIVVKGDMIEFQLDGGGFGTFGDDTTTTVAAKPADKSDYEKDLERQISETDDADRKQSLQRDLDRERARRAKQDAANQRAAQIASQAKAAQVAENRERGGSRFNLRWSGSIPADQLNPDAIMKLLAEYVDFSGPKTPDVNPTGAIGAPASGDTPTSNEPAGSPTAQLKRGMNIEEVTTLLGPGKQTSESVGDGGLKTQVYEYSTSDRHVQVTYVDGILVRFAISSK